ncbi:hypothetical protein [Absidia glauca]|uniref:Arf-GAP domain-containing protein n=1 Tax=Absidia glauca TaxID=4829 RepID=A0A168MVN2_ABSGL|nr:hypothetical protein [Absidia glauca]
MASSILLRKQEELNARLVRDLLRLPENKKCFDCPTKSPFFVNITLQTFICSRCSGLVREVGHRVKSISASKFTGPELTALEHGGNGIAGKIWLSCGYNTVDTPEPESDGEVRAFMRQKYYEKKWLNRDLAISHDMFVKNRLSELFTEEGEPKQPQQQRRRRSTLESSSNQIDSNRGSFEVQQQQQQQHQRGKNIPAPLNLSSTYKAQAPTIQTAPLTMNALQPQPKLSSPKLYNGVVPGLSSSSSSVSSSLSIPASPPPSTKGNFQQQPTAPMDSIFSDLAGLTLSRPPPVQPTTPPASLLHHHHSGATNNPTNRRATYTGGILTPTFSNKINNNHDNSKRYSVQPTTTMSASRTMITDNLSPSSNHKRTTSLQNDDPYSALRAHHEEQQLKHQQMVSAIMSTTRQVSSSTSTSSSVTSHDSKTQQESADPYAALRQLSEGSTEPPTLTILPSSSSTWSPPKAQPHQSYPEQSHVALWQEKLQPAENDEWVEAEPYEPEDDEDEDIMTQSSSTTALSTTSSTKSHIANHVNIFGDLDPLAAYKRNKGFTTAPVQPNLI